ncbi:hypothetical protein Tco_1523061 [Tanacetum coccineum]
MEVKKLIKEENLQFCAILETHVKYKNIKKTCDNVFGNWESIYNGEDNNKGCRIMVGWNTNIIQTWLISHSRQFLQMESIDKKSKFFCTMIYASNSGMERRKFTLKGSEALQMESAYISNDMAEFQECINKVEIDNLHSEGFHYTWTKSLKNPKAEKLRMEVKECQKEVENFPHDDKVKDKSYNVLKEYNEAIQDEYSLLCQKAKVEWLREEDKNTAYFHKTIKERVHRGRIMTIRNEEGVGFENEEVATQIVKHFEDFLGKSRTVKKMIGRKDIFTNKIKPDEALMMVRPISEAEIKNAMFEIEDSKANSLLGVVNATVITLVPKISTPDKVSDFRPIACCNVLYKCISKILTSRIKGNLKITHLCFADDLLVFCHGDTQSVGIIKKSLDEFSEHTPNMHKSTIFFGGLSNAEQQNILNLCLFTVVDKVRSKVNDWKNKALSYAGRVQLIASILSSMQNYWASVFLLPKQVIYEINKMLKGFLWCQGELANGKANVSWETVCKPKNQGGLGIKDLGVWNEHIRWKLGNGKSVNVWHDRWCSVSPLSDFITTRDMYDARLRNECTVREVIHEGRWKWPAEWNNDFAELDQLQVPMSREDMEDKADKIKMWRPNEDLKCALCSKCTDSHNHLFFTCEFSNEVLKELVKLLNVRLSEGWDQIIMEMVALPLNKNIWSVVRRIVCSAAVYYIWQERNNRLYQE